jgi:flagellar export protein FliJ
MAFQFSLQAVYHFRKSVEHQFELRLRLANQQVSKARHLIEQVNDRVNALQAQTNVDMGAGLTGAEMQFTTYVISVLRAHRGELERELTRLKNLRDQQQRAFAQARRERETLESLREQHLHAYEREQARREQQLLDEMFLLQRSYKRSG